MIVGLSQVALGLGSIFAALLLYRQPASLLPSSKVIASLLVMCCLFISIFAWLSLFIDANSEDTRTFQLMLTNLHFFLALPLFSSVIFASSINRQFSKATWGRWSLVLIAIFELCRRAEIGDIYSNVVIVTSVVMLGFSLLARSFLDEAQTMNADIQYKALAIVSFGCALIVFSEKTILQGKSDIVLYNITLAVALIFICLLIGKKLPTEDVNH